MCTGERINLIAVLERCHPRGMKRDVKYARRETNIEACEKVNCQERIKQDQYCFLLGNITSQTNAEIW